MTIEKPAARAPRRPREGAAFHRDFGRRRRRAFGSVLVGTFAGEVFLKGLLHRLLGRERSRCGSNAFQKASGRHGDKNGLEKPPKNLGHTYKRTERQALEVYFVINFQ